MSSSCIAAGFLDANWWQALSPGVAALLVLVLGAGIALLVRLLAGRLLEAAGFNRLWDRVGFTELLRQGAVGHSPARLTALALQWVVLVAMVLWSLQLVGMRVVSDWLAQVGETLPAVMSAIGIAILGYAGIAFLANVVRTIARNSASPHAELLARTVKWVGTLLVIWVAIDQLGVELRAISSVVQILVAAVALGLALAFGLGCKDLARDAMQKFLRNLRERRQPPPTDLEG